MKVRDRLLQTLGGFGGMMLVGLLVLPLVGLIVATSPAELWLGMQAPLFRPALMLSLQTTALSLCAIIAMGTPLAWWLSRADGRLARAIEMLVHVPIVTPPAVLGVALLFAFGRTGLLGPLLETTGVQLSFTTAAVVIAQIVVAAPFYVQSATTAFSRIDDDMLLVAWTLGASPIDAFFRVALPVALPGLVVGACLSWARALGEFGATLLFAGNLRGETQTMPLAIFAALESDVRVAVALSVVLVAIGAVLLLALRALPGVGRGQPAEPR